MRPGSSGTLGGLELILWSGPKEQQSSMAGDMAMAPSHPPGLCRSRVPIGRWGRCWAPSSRHRSSSWLCGATISDVGTTFCRTKASTCGEGKGWEGQCEAA